MIKLGYTINRNLIYLYVLCSLISCSKIENKTIVKPFYYCEEVHVNKQLFSADSLQIIGEIKSAINIYNLF
jgi:hypothetical protein